MPNEIEVTPHMIEAGIEALAGAPEPDGDNASEMWKRSASQWNVPDERIGPSGLPEGRLNRRS